MLRRLLPLGAFAAKPRPAMLRQHAALVFAKSLQLGQRRWDSSSSSVPLGRAFTPDQARLLIGFTCKVCNHRQHKTMSKQAYTKGVVLVQCDGCKNRHLIADNLGWFRDKAVNIEQLMQEKGEDVCKLQDAGLLDGWEAEQVSKVLNEENNKKDD